MRLKEMEKYAIGHKIPIIEKESIEYIKKYIKDNNVKTILELGTAIGYSTIQMALVSDDIHITTIDRDEERIKIAKESIKEYVLENRIKVIEKDILDVIIYEKFDLIFIDAAKSQYINFFNKFKGNLNKNGAIISDNLGFHGYVDNQNSIKSKNVTRIVRKIINYIDFLNNNKEFKTEIINVGDKIAISKVID